MRPLLLLLFVAALASCEKKTTNPEDNTIGLGATITAEAKPSGGFYWQVKMMANKSIEAPITVTAEWTGWDADMAVERKLTHTITIAAGSTSNTEFSAWKTASTKTATYVKIIGVSCPVSKYTFSY